MEEAHYSFFLNNRNDIIFWTHKYFLDTRLIYTKNDKERDKNCSLREKRKCCKLNEQVQE